MTIATRSPSAWRLIGRAVLVCSAGTLFAACSQEGRPSDARAALQPCRLKGVDIAVRCGQIVVAEDRDSPADPAGRTITIHYAVIPALARKPEPDAIFVLAGGPGQAASDIAAIVHPLFAKLNQDRDIVLVDQRGTGTSGRLSCAAETASALSGTLDPLDLEAGAARCAERLSRTADLTRYGTRTAMQDLDDVRAILGYPRIDLWGASYGSRAALAYLQQFPDRVRTMTLDGVAPAGQKLPISFGVDTHAALVDLARDCAHEAACAQAHPDLNADIAALFAKTDAGQLPITVTNPSTGKRERLRLTRTALASLLRAPLYNSLTASLLPAAIGSAIDGDFDVLVALSYTVGSGLEDKIALGMHLAVLCGEDVAAMTAADVATAQAEGTRSVVDGRPNPFATIYVDQYRRLCAHWPTRSVDASRTAERGTNVPTMLLSGGIDPATPPAHAQSVARTLTRVRQVVAPNIAHGVSTQGCAPALIERFIRTADPEAPDIACMAGIPRPPFYATLVEARRATDTLKPLGVERGDR